MGVGIRIPEVPSSLKLQNLQGFKQSDSPLLSFWGLTLVPQWCGLSPGVRVSRPILPLFSLHHPQGLLIPLLWVTKQGFPLRIRP